MATTVIRKRISRYTVNATPEGRDQYNHLWEISVEASAQSDGSMLWAVRWMGQCLNRRGGWDVEPMSWTATWLRAHRFELETALRLAEAAAPDVEVNGVKARDV